MGLYDRDYARASSRDGWISAGSWSATYVLIAVHVAAVVLQLVSREAYDQLSMAPAPVFFQGEVWRLFTGVFFGFNVSPWAVLWLCLFLWWTGQELEAMYGRANFLAYYLGSGFLVCLAWGLVLLGDFIPGPVLDSAPAVAAVLFLYAFHFPTQIIHIWGVLPVPVWAIALVYVLGDVAVGPGVLLKWRVPIYMAAALCAFLYLKFDLRWTTWSDRLVVWKQRRRRAVDEPAVLPMSRRAPAVVAPRATEPRAAEP
ncbi:MAG: rhomboid family intramembrane serine protease, partial [Planctomycetia bacterium]